MNKLYNSFFKFKKRNVDAVPVLFKFLIFFKFIDVKSRRPPDYVDMPFYNSSLVLTFGHYKPLSKIVNLTALEKHGTSSK